MRVHVSGAHAAAFNALFRASHRLDAWLGGASETDDSFPLTDGGNLPADRWFRAEFTSRSCVTPHALHTQVLTTSMSRPVGPVRALQLLHVRVESLSLTMITLLPACWPLYCNCALSMPQPASSTDLAIRVFASFRLLTSPIFMVWYSLTIFLENLCRASF